MAEARDRFRAEDTHNSARCDCQLSMTRSNRPFSANVNNHPLHLVTLGLKFVVVVGEGREVREHTLRQRHSPPTPQRPTQRHEENVKNNKPQRKETRRTTANVDGHLNCYTSSRKIRTSILRVRRIPVGTIS